MFTPFFLPPWLEVSADCAPRLCTYRVALLEVMSTWGGRVRRYVMLLNHACIILCLLCFPPGQLSTRQRRASPALWDTSHAATWPCASPSPCTATASTTAAIKPTRRTAVSHRPLSVPWRNEGGHAEERSQSASLRLMALYECAMCAVCVLLFACRKTQITATGVLLLARLSLLLLLPISCSPNSSWYFKHSSFCPNQDLTHHYALGAQLF